MTLRKRQNGIDYEQRSTVFPSGIDAYGRPAPSAAPAAQQGLPQLDLRRRQQRQGGGYQGVDIYGRRTGGLYGGQGGIDPAQARADYQAWKQRDLQDYLGRLDAARPRPQTFADESPEAQQAAIDRIKQDEARRLGGYGSQEELFAATDPEAAAQAARRQTEAIAAKARLADATRVAAMKEADRRRRAATTGGSILNGGYIFADNGGGPGTTGIGLKSNIGRQYTIDRWGRRRYQ